MPGLIRTTISVLILSAFTGTAFYRGLVSHPSIPVRKPASVTSPEDNSQEAIDAIARDLEPQLRTLTRPVTVYHWSSTSPTLDAAVEKGKRSAGLFWDSTTDMNYGLVGHGLYAARDPVSSSSFGRRPGSVLLAITLPTNARFLDIRNVLPNTGAYRGDDYEASNQIMISNASVELAKKAGCVAFKSGHINYRWLISLPCTNLLRGALRKLHVAGTIHRWWGGKVKGCVEEAATFTVFDETLFNAQSVRVHSFDSPSSFDQLDEDGKEQALMIVRFAIEQTDHPFPSGDSTYLLNRAGSSALLTRAREISRDSYNAWLHQTVFNCSGKYPEEPVSVPQKSVDLTAGAPNGDVVIDSATFGSNLKKVAAGNATQAAASFCSSKTECDYKVSPRFLGNLMPGVPKSFHIEWSCSGIPGYQENEVPAPSDGETFKISCAPGTIRVNRATYGRNVVEPKAGNSTTLVEQQCRGKSYCSIKGSDLHLEDPMPGATKKIAIQWHCSKTPEKPIESEIQEDESFAMSCWR